MGFKDLNWRERFIIYVVVSILTSQFIAMVTLDRFIFATLFTIPPYSIICIVLLSISAFIEIKYFK
jgi:hypothetical protein